MKETLPPINPPPLAYKTHNPISNFIVLIYKPLYDIENLADHSGSLHLRRKKYKNDSSILRFVYTTQKVQLDLQREVSVATES